MPYDSILVAVFVIGTACAVVGNEFVIFVLVHFHRAVIFFKLFIIRIVCAGIALGCHDRYPPAYDTVSKSQERLLLLVGG